jgi:hypothetical protein
VSTVSTLTIGLAPLIWLLARSNNHIFIVKAARAGYRTFGGGFERGVESVDAVDSSPFRERHVLDGRMRFPE